jgi:hypothetical protein
MLHKVMYVSLSVNCHGERPSDDEGVAVFPSRRSRFKQRTLKQQQIPRFASSDKISAALFSPAVNELTLLWQEVGMDKR